MRKILLLVILTGVGFLAKAQTNPFPSTDSLERFINRYIRNSPVEAFQNLRMNTALIGLLRYIQGSELGSGLDTAYALNDSTLRLITGEPDTLDIVLRGKPIITSARVAFGGADNRITDDADLTYTAATNRLNTGTGNFSDSLLVGRLRDGTVSDSVVVWDNSTKALKKVAQSSIAGAPALTTIVRRPLDVLAGDSAMGIPDTLVAIYDNYTITIDAVDSVLRVDTNVIATLDTTFKIMTRAVVVVDTIQFIHSGAGSATYQNNKLIGSKLLNLHLENYPVGFISRSTSVWMAFDPGTGIITLTNGEFAADDLVLILYRTYAIFLVDGNGDLVTDSNGNYIIVN